MAHRGGRVIGALAVIAVAASTASCSDRPTDRPTPTNHTGAVLRYSGAPRAIAPDLIGVNGEGISADASGYVWRDPGFTRAVSSLRAGNLRLFGGTSANLWDWKLGRLGRSSIGGIGGYVAGHPEVPITLRQFLGVTKAAAATGLFDLNMVSSTLGDQLAMLRAAQADGVPVKRVELGNELWAWQYRTSFTDGAAYAKVANTWIAALHREFPGVKIAVPVNDPTAAEGPRGRLWNKQVSTTIRDADAVALHVYLQAAESSPAEVATAPLTQWSAALRRVTPSLSTDVPIWITEWNYMPAEAQQPLSWARAIGGAELAVRMVEDPRVELADFHDLVGFVGSSYAAIRAISTSGSAAGPFRYYLTAAGRMLQLLVSTLSGCRSVQGVDTASVTPHAVAPRLVGVACRAPAPVRVMVVNPTSKSLLLDTTAIVGQGTYTVTRVSASATSPSDAAPAGVQTKSSDGAVRVPPWSLVTLKS